MLGAVIYFRVLQALLLLLRSGAECNPSCTRRQVALILCVVGAVASASTGSEYAAGKDCTSLTQLRSTSRHMFIRCEHNSELHTVMLW
jgi:hypothetical protein